MSDKFEEVMKSELQSATKDMLKELIGEHGVPKAEVRKLFNQFGPNNHNLYDFTCCDLISLNRRLYDEYGDKTTVTEKELGVLKQKSDDAENVVNSIDEAFNKAQDKLEDEYERASSIATKEFSKVLEEYLQAAAIFNKTK